MFKFIFLFTAIVFVALDFMYLNLIKNYFSKQIISVQGEKLTVNFLGAAICYILLITGLNYFIIEPKKSVYDAFLLGIVIYGVYETTNYSLFKNWSILTVIIDTLWGGILFATTTFLSKQVRNIF
jgi:uncharacterized membrane protein